MSHEPTALVAVADGSEEIEFVSTVDTLARGGVKVTTASVEGRCQVNCSRGVSCVADTTIDDVHGQTFDVIALPGGMPGAKHLRDNATLTSMLQEQRRGFQDTMPNLSTDRVVTTDHVVTSQGPGTAIEFALELVARLQGNDKAAKVAKPMLPAQGCVVPVAHH